MKPYTLHHGDCLEVLRTLPDASVDAVVCDPPYGLSFMGKRWDYDVPAVEVWAECLRVLKPGGHLLAFAGTRTQHRMAVRIEDAGFDIRDLIAWVYGSGFPKSLDVSKAIDSMDASEEQQRRRLRFTAWVRSTGVTSRQIDETTGTSMGGHYTTASSQPAIMTREHLEACRHLLGNVPEWAEREADIRSVESRNMAEREVVGSKIGTNTTEVRIACPVSSQGIERSTRHEFKITAPATPAARAWQGWGTALKPALEPITVARKPLDGTVAENVLAHGTGALNVDGCRVEALDGGYSYPNGPGGNVNPTSLGLRADGTSSLRRETPVESNPLGRWPANLIHDGSEEVVGLFPETESGRLEPHHNQGPKMRNVYAGGLEPHCSRSFGGDSGSAARFFYCAKAAGDDRDAGALGLFWRAASTSSGWEQIAEALYWTLWNENEAARKAKQRPPHVISRGNLHPTVKPTDLMRYLCRLVTPPRGVVLDPFTGSGSTGRGAILEGFRFIGIEREADYLAIARARIDDAVAMRARETAQLTLI